MNWEAIGAVGEILSAGGVVITLIYLTVQLRQTTHAMKSATFQAINDGMSQVSQVLATDPALAGLFLKAQDGLSALNPEERVRFSFALVMAMRRLHAVDVQREFGMVSDEFADGYERSVTSVLLSLSGAREWWVGGKDAFPQSFVERINGILASGTVGEARQYGLSPDQPPAGESS
jgi:hypothetical protein